MDFRHAAPYAEASIRERGAWATHFQTALAHLYSTSSHLASAFVAASASTAIPAAVVARESASRETANRDKAEKSLAGGGVSK